MGETCSSIQVTSLANSLIASIRLSKKLLLRNRILIGELRQVKSEAEHNRKRSGRLVVESRMISAEYTNHGEQALRILTTVASLVGHHW